VLRLTPRIPIVNCRLPVTTRTVLLRNQDHVQQERRGTKGGSSHIYLLGRNPLPDPILLPSWLQVLGHLLEGPEVDHLLLLSLAGWQIAGGPSSEGKRSRREPFMHEEQAEEAPGRARPRRRTRSRNIPANSRPAVWSFIVQRADESRRLRRSPEKQTEVWAFDRFQDRPGRRAAPARRSRGSGRCTFLRCRRACARKC